jgi:hypothetical protein
VLGKDKLQDSYSRHTVISSSIQGFCTNQTTKLAISTREITPHRHTSYIRCSNHTVIRSGKCLYVFVWRSLGRVWGEHATLRRMYFYRNNPFLLFYFLHASCKNVYTYIDLIITLTTNYHYTQYTYMDHFASPNGQAPLGSGGSPSPRHLIRIGRMTKMYAFLSTSQIYCNAFFFYASRLNIGSSNSTQRRSDNRRFRNRLWYNCTAWCATAQPT